MPPLAPLPDDPRVTGRRRARAAAALGVCVGSLVVWGSLAALNHWVLGFHAWPDQRSAPSVRLVVPDEHHGQRTTAPSVVALAPIAGTPGVVAGSGALLLAPASAPEHSNSKSVAVSGRGRTGSPGGVVAPGNGGTVAGGAGDPDGDGVTTAAEIRLGTNPSSADTDNDGVPDGWEIRNGLNPRSFRDATADGDGDGVPNRIEFRLGNDPRRAVSRDGIPDGERDTNGDGVTDAQSVAQGLDPVAPAPEPATDGTAAPDSTPQPASEPEPAQPPSQPADQPAPTPAVQPEPAPEPTPETVPEPSPDPVPAAEPPPVVDQAPPSDTGGVAAPDEASPASDMPATTLALAAEAPQADAPVTP